MGPNYFWVIIGFMPPPIGSLCSCVTQVFFCDRGEEEAHPEQFYTWEGFLKKMCHNFPGDWCPQIFPGGWPKIWLLFWEPPAAHQNCCTIVFSGTQNSILCSHLLPSFLTSLRVLDRRRIQRSTKVKVTNFLVAHGLCENAKTLWHIWWRIIT